MSNEQIAFKTRWRTAWILVIILLALIGWDVYAAFFSGGSGGTISEVILGFARKHPAFPFSVGAVAGHLLWPQEVKE